MKFAVFIDGLPIAFYDEEINAGQIPGGAVAISDLHWKEFINNQGRRKWDGAKPVAYEPPYVPPPLPKTVSASQAKITLLGAGLLDMVDAAVAAHPYRPVRIWYADANQWERGHPYVQALGAELGLTDEVIDDLFVQASQL